MAFFKKSRFLIQRICGTAVPVAALCRDRRCEYIHAALLTSKSHHTWKNSSAHSGTGVVLRQYRHTLDVGIAHIAQSKIDTALVLPAIGIAAMALIG